MEVSDSSLRKLSHRNLAVGAAAVGAASLVSAQADAQQVTVTETINIDQLLSAGGGDYTGSFSLSGLMANGLTQADVLSASVTAYGYSDLNSVNYNNNTNSSGYSTIGGYSYVSGYYYYLAGYYQYYYYYQCGWGYCQGYGYTPYYALGTIYQDVSEDGQTNVTTHTGITAAMNLTAGSSHGNGSAGTSYYYNSGVGAYQQTGSSNGGCSGGGPVTNCYQTLFYNRYQDIYSAYYGEVDSHADLTLADIELLIASGGLGFDVNAGSGNFNLNSITLTLIYDEVPEPGSLALLLSGVGAASALRRRRRAKLDS